MTASIPLVRRGLPQLFGALLLIGYAAQVRAAESAGDHPGFMWSQARNHSDLVDERGNQTIEGALQQGLDLGNIGRHGKINAFVQLQGQWDDQGLDWNRKYSYSLGGKLTYTGFTQTHLSIGARHDKEKHVESGRSREGTTAFVNWASYWDLDSPLEQYGWSADMLGFPGTTWGQLRYPASHFGEESTSTLVEGAVEQGIDWVRLAENVTLNTFARFEYTLDSRELEWNNKIKAGPGIKLKVLIGETGLLEFGAKYQWHHRMESGRTAHGTLLFVNWNIAWDFGEFAQKFD